MAYQDTLFQLGMDLTRSSTAQKEDRGSTAHVAHNAGTVHRTHEARQSSIAERQSVRFAGQHLIIDLFDASRLDDPAHIERTLEHCVEVAGGRLLHSHMHQVEPNGSVSGVAVFPQSHISIHSWPQAGYATLHVFLRGDCEPQRLIDVLRVAFAAGEIVVKEHKRGEEYAPPRWQSAVAKKPPSRLRKVRAA